MKTMILLPLAALAACAVAADQPSPNLTTADEAALTEVLAERTPGDPVNCVRQQTVHNTRSVGGNAVLFDGPSGILYVNRTSGSCPRIQPWHAIRHRAINSAICSGELIRVFDPQTGVEYGGCTLGEFTPWRRVR